MKKILFLCSMVFCLINCKNKIHEESQEALYYPSREYFNSSNLKKINLELNYNFRDIVNKINRIHRNDSLPFLEFEKGNSNIKIIPLRNDYGLFYGKNSLRLTKDSVFLFYKNYPITQLSELLKIHYENNGRVPYLSESPEKAVVEIELDPNETGKRLIEILKILTNNFDSLNAQHNDSLELKIALGIPLPPPPMPPPPVEN